MCVEVRDLVCWETALQKEIVPDPVRPRLCAHGGVAAVIRG